MLKTQTVKIGILTLISIALLYLGVNYLKGLNLLKKQNIYYASFVDVKGLTVASPVLVKGFKVGVVKALSFDYNTGDATLVELDLDSQYKVPMGSHVTIHQNALAGSEVRILQAPISNGYHKAGDELQVDETTGDIMALASKRIVPAIADFMPKVDSLLDGLVAIVSNPQIGTALSNLSKAAKEIEETSITLNKNLASQMPRVMSNLGDVSENAKTLTSNTMAFSEQLKDIKLQGVLENLEKSTESLRQTIAQLQSTESTMGLMLNDKNLYWRLDSLANSTEKLMRDIKENPNRYVHFSVF